MSHQKDSFLEYFDKVNGTPQHQPDHIQRETNCSKASHNMEPMDLSTPPPRTEHLCTASGCNRIFKKAAHLKEHLLIHTGERPFICTVELCGASFKRESHLKIHAQSVHFSSTSHFSCPFSCCKSSFGLKDNLIRHERNSHSFSISAKDPVPSNLIKCTTSDCKAIFTTERQLKKHLLGFHSFPSVHHCLYSTYGCKSTFEYRSRLKTHMLHCRYKPLSALITSSIGSENANEIVP